MLTKQPAFYSVIIICFHSASVYQAMWYAAFIINIALQWHLTST